MYISCWRKIPKTKEDWCKGFSLDNNKLHMEDYEFWYLTDQAYCVEADKDGTFKIPKEYEATEETETVKKYIYGIKHVPQFAYFKIITWHRHPNHWER